MKDVFYLLPTIFVEPTEAGFNFGLCWLNISIVFRFRIDDWGVRPCLIRQFLMAKSIAARTAERRRWRNRAATMAVVPIVRETASTNSELRILRKSSERMKNSNGI